MAFIEGVDRNQQMMFPEYLEDYITENNIVRFIEEYVNTLNLDEMGFKIRKAGPGAPAYHPASLVKLYLYGYINSIRSSRKLEKEAHRNIELIWLIKKLTPDFKTIADFRKNNKDAIKAVFKDFTLLCKDMQLFGEDLVAVDGTKIKASNSKKNNYNQKKVDRQLKYIEEKTNEYLQMLDSSDDNEMSEKKLTADELKKKLENLKNRKTKYREIESELKESGKNEISTVDPDSRLMDNKNNGVEISYNVQTVVDSKHSLIVEFDITNNPSDQGNLNSMAEKAKEVFGKDEIEVVADKGYYQADDLKKCEKNHTTTYITKQTQSNATGERDFYGDKFKYDAERDLYVCPAGQELYRIKHKKKDPDRIRYRNYGACQKCEYKDKCTTSDKGRDINRSSDQDFLDIVDARTRENMDKYLKRQMIVEHPFGTIKRNMNAGYFLTRGMSSVICETALVLLAYNIKRVVNILGIKILISKLRELRPATTCYI